MTEEEQKKNLIPKCHEDEVPKCIVQNYDEDDDEDDDDTDYIPTIVEEQEADKETKHIHSLAEENENEKIEKPKLDEKKAKEIEALWEQMKTSSTNQKLSNIIEINVENIEKTTNTISSFAENNKIIVDNKPIIPVPMKRKRISTMDDIIKKHSTSKRLSTLDKSKKLWQIYRQEENIGAELDIQSRNSHIEKTSFLYQAKYNEWKKGQEYRLRDMLKKQNKP